MDAARRIFNLGSQSFILKTAGNEVPDQVCLTILLQRVLEINKEKSERRALDFDGDSMLAFIQRLLFIHAESRN